MFRIVCISAVLIAGLAEPVAAQSRQRKFRGQSDDAGVATLSTPAVTPPSKTSDIAPARTNDTPPAKASDQPTTSAMKGELLNLQALEQLAEQSHPVLKQSRARVTSAQGQALQEGLYPNPRFDTNNPQVFNGQGSLLNVGFQQELVTMGKLRLQRAAATKIVGQSELAYVTDRFNLLTAVRKQYYTTLAAQRRVDVVAGLSRITADSLQVGRDLFGAEKINETEVLLLEVDYETVQADLTSARKKLDGERKQLSAVVGIPGLVTGRIAGNLTEKPPVFDEENTRLFVTESNSQVTIARLEVERTKIVLKRQQAEPYPNVTIGPAFQQGVIPGGQNFWFNVQFPIPTSNLNQGNIMSARADARIASEALSKLQLDLQNQIADLYSTHQAARIRAEKYREKIIPDSLRMLGLARDGFKNGVFDFSRFLQAQRTMVDANMRYTDILEELWTTGSDLAGLLQIEQFP